MTRALTAVAGLSLSLIMVAPVASASLIQVSFAGSIDRIDSPPQGGGYELFSLGQVGGTYTGTLLIDTDLLVPSTPGTYSLPPGAATLSLTLEPVYTPPVPFPLIPTGSGGIGGLETPPTYHWSAVTDTLSGNPGFGGPVRAQLEFRYDTAPGAIADFVPVSLSDWSSARLVVLTRYQVSSQFIFQPTSSGPLSQWSVNRVPEPDASALLAAGLALLALRRERAR